MAFRLCEENEADHVNVLNACKATEDMTPKDIDKNFAIDASSQFLLDATPNMAVDWGAHAGLLNAAWLGCTNSDDFEARYDRRHDIHEAFCHSAVP